MSLERKARAYVAAVEGGAVGDDLAAFYHPDAVQYEFPNRLVPHGAQRDLDAILQGAERGMKLMERQIYDIHTVTELGDRIILGAHLPGDRVRGRPDHPPAQLRLFRTFLIR